MFRQLLAASAVAVVGVFAVAGVATAAPGDPTSYPPPPAETSTSATVGITVTVSVSGGGMLPGEQVSVTAVPNGPSGLRANAALRAQSLRVAAAGVIVTADASGGFAAAVPFPKGQSGTIVAAGLTSGHTVSFSVSADGSAGGGVGGGATVPVNGSTTDDTPPPASSVDDTPSREASTSSEGQSSSETTTIPAEVESSSTLNVAPAPVEGAMPGGLASTGASIAGPLTVGFGALIIGLAMLFFGTRLAIRRRATQH